MSKLLTILFFSLLLFFNLYAQTSLPDSCKLKIGTNLREISDYGTELPFVDLMHNCRSWFTKDVGNPEEPWDSGNAVLLSYRDDGYPTELPQNVEGVAYPQIVETIWAVTDGWPAGTYTVFYEGTGELEFDFVNSSQVDSNKIIFDLPNPIGGSVAMKIKSSLASNPIKNIRVIMPGHENTYIEKPFYPLWIEKLSIFKTVRFMDWGATNNWGQKDSWTWEDTTMFNWSDRAKMDNYTWANSKGIPYEMMIKLMNEYKLDAWVCVPHRATNNYIEEMAKLFKNNLYPDKKLYVEYSNEIWNWMFGQCQWLNKYGCINNNISWPEGIVPYIQNVMDIWTNVYGTEINRIERVVGVQTAWQDVSNRVVFNMRPGSFDSFATTAYFALPDEGDTVLDSLGSGVDVADIAYWARYGREKYEKQWIKQQKATIADSLHIPMRFYEGGQHLTPYPFGEEPTYANALLNIQRDTSMYNLYMEWFDFLKTLQSGNEPLQLMNFSFIAGRSAQYGSWGILEALDQDTSIIPAPKYKAIKETIENCHNSVVSLNNNSEDIITLKISQNYPNPFNPTTTIQYSIPSKNIVTLKVYDILGKEVANLVNEYKNAGNYEINFDGSNLSSGTYFYQLKTGEFSETKKLLLLK